MDERSMYLKKTYGKIPKVLTEFDEKMIKAITLMKSKYGNTERRCVMMTDGVKLEKERAGSETKTSFAVKETPVKKQKVVTVVCTCKATKMNGELCTAKAKPGFEFCGRHIPK